MSPDSTLEMPDYSRLTPLAWGILWAVLVTAAISLRPLMPVDETRYVTVAWEMWLRGDYLVPHLNGATYSHKPPLLFWLINAGWGVFGVNEWWPRLVAPLFGLASLSLSALTCRRLWPDSQAYLIVPILLLGTFYWGIYTTLTMFDLIIALWTLVGINGLIDVWQGRRMRGWLLFAVAIGFGVLSKGPVILVYLLPTALLAPYWAVAATRPNWPAWYVGLIVSVLLGAGIALAWAIPAGFAGGEEYRNAIFWGQSAGRMVKSFAHREPFWWYLAILPGLLLPWLIWPSLLKKLWQNFRDRSQSEADPGLRLSLVWAVATILILSAISGKRPHYLLPMFPALAICGAVLVASIAKGDFLRGRWDMVPPTLFLIILGAAAGFAPEIGAAVNRPELTAEIERLWALPLVALAIFLVLKPPQSGYPRLFAIAATSAIFIISIQAVLQPVLNTGYDLRPTAKYLAKAQQQGYVIAHFGKYHGQFQFLGRLEKPIIITGDGEVIKWLANRPQAKIISVHTKLDGNGPKPDFVQKYRRKYLAVWDRATVLAHPTAPHRN
jgi:4-amino-4-deoxy-L-arabinose transferase-like glycosyltransferase